MQQVVLLFMEVLLLQLLIQLIKQEKVRPGVIHCLKIMLNMVFGMMTAVDKLRDRIALRMTAAMEDGIKEETKAAFAEWLENKDKGEASRTAGQKVVAALEKESHAVAKENP